MKGNNVKTPETTEEVSSFGLVKLLANQCSRKKIKKKPHAGGRRETKWEIPGQMGNPD